MTGDTGKPIRILLADDGELDEVRRILRDQGFAVARPDEARAGAARVLISSAGHALSRAPLDARRVRFHIVVTERISSVLRRELDRIRPDFVLERPVDPTVLRLLIQHALYSGPERRRGERVPMKASVRCRIGRASRSATLVEISKGGCRLETKGCFEPGQRLTVVLPAELTGTRHLQLEARVVGAASGAASRPDRSLTSVAFLPQETAARSALRSLVAAGAAGAGALRPRAPERAGPEPSPTRARSDDPPRLPPPGPLARRRSPRGSYRRSILASGAGSAQVLVGRDLSLGGMRVNPDPLLVVGQELKLVIHGTAGQPPAVVKARVARDEGSEGCVLHFRALPAATRDRLEAIVRELPGARPADAGTRGPNVVVAAVALLAR